MISKATMGFCALGGVSVASLASITAVYWTSIKNNPTVKSVYQRLSILTNLGGIVNLLENEPDPLPNNIPTYTLLSSSTSHTDTSKFGGKYRNVLVGENNNDDWWKWSIQRNKDLEALDGEFKQIKGKGENDFQTLKTACTNSYKKEDSQIKDVERRNAWFLCSPFGSEPSSVGELPKFSYQFARPNNTASSFLIADRPKNKNVWDEIYKLLIKDKTISDDPFSKVKRGYSSKKDEDNPSLNKTCDDFYYQTEDEIKANKSNIWKYCSLSGQEPSTT